MVDRISSSKFTHVLLSSFPGVPTAADFILPSLLRYLDQCFRQHNNRLPGAAITEIW